MPLFSSNLVGSENTEMTFVQQVGSTLNHQITHVLLVLQEVSKNDSYCWICHEGGEVLCCDKCPRVLHLRCSNLSSEPEGDEWNCPTCRVGQPLLKWRSFLNKVTCSLLNFLCCQGIAKKLKRSRPPNLKELLSLAVKRMMFPGVSISN